jgi:predicted nucleic acid-binding Zn ribbon protein
MCEPPVRAASCPVTGMIPFRLSGTCLAVRRSLARRPTGDVATRVRGRTNSRSVRCGFPPPFRVETDRNNMPNPKRRGPKALSEILGELFTVRGYGRLRALGELEQAWNTAVGEPHCHQTRVGEVRRGVLTVIVAHPTLLEELAAFRKPELLQALRAGAPATPIQDIRFRVGPIDEPAAPEPERTPSQPRPTPPPGRMGTGTSPRNRPRRRPRSGDNDR